MLSCREVTRLMASDGFQGARLLRRLELRVHLLYCRHCRRYVRELQEIAAAARRLLLDEQPDPVRVAELERSIRDRARRRAGPHSDAEPPLPGS